MKKKNPFLNQPTSRAGKRGWATTHKTSLYYSTVDSNPIPKRFLDSYAKQNLLLAGFANYNRGH